MTKTHSRALADYHCTKPKPNLYKKPNRTIRVRCDLPLIFVFKKNLLTFAFLFVKMLQCHFKINSDFKPHQQGKLQYTNCMLIFTKEGEYQLEGFQHKAEKNTFRCLREDSNDNFGETKDNTKASPLAQ